jgi:hypothetical protein
VAEEKYTQSGKCPVCGRTIGLSGGGNLMPHLDQRKRGPSGYYDDCPGARQKPAK